MFRGLGFLFLSSLLLSSCGGGLPNSSKEDSSSLISSSDITTSVAPAGDVALTEARFLFYPSNVRGLFKKAIGENVIPYVASDTYKCYNGSVNQSIPATYLIAYNVALDCEEVFRRDLAILGFQADTEMSEGMYYATAKKGENNLVIMFNVVELAMGPTFQAITFLVPTSP